MLEHLNLGNNKIVDIFPFWLEPLPELKILLLRSNQFHGPIAGYLSHTDFPRLHMVDLSYNGFMGELPSQFFLNWNGTRLRNRRDSTYAQIDATYPEPNYDVSENYTFSMTIRNKGVDTYYSAIQSVFAAIDLSSNKFEGEICVSIGNLKGLQFLNLSNNGLSGCIPSSLGSLTDLQALDLSQNELSGVIPQQLTQLTFLTFLNVSHNHLSGPIPHGNQFATFENNSFDGNSGLCGDLLSKKCGSFEALPLPPLNLDNEDSKFPTENDWIVICMGYASGLVVGLTIGHLLNTSRHEWYIRVSECMQ